MDTQGAVVILRVAAAAGGVIALATVALLCFENRLIYSPSRYPEGDWDARTRSGVATEEVFFRAADGVRLHAWHLRPAGSAPPLCTLLYFHGNAGNLTERYGWASDLSGLPAEVFLVDYRGYGKSDGRPGEAGIYQDAEGAWRHLTGTLAVPPSRLVIYGKSLGGAAACELAARHECAALVLQSTFTSARDVARKSYPLLPAHLFMRTRFDNLAKMKRINSPVLILHSRDDEVIPFHMAERLHAAARGPKKLAAFDGSQHNGLPDDHGPEIVAAIRGFLVSTATAPLIPPPTPR